MLNIPEAIKALFKQDGVRKNFRAHFPNGELPDITNSDIVQESVKFSESLCSQDVFKFGLTEASVIEFETVGVPNMYGMWIECSCEIDTSSLSASELASAGAEGFEGTLVLAENSDIGYGFYRVPYGRFRVESCPRNHEAMAHRLVTAYSASAASLAKGLPQLPSKLAYQTVFADPAAFFSQMTESNLISKDLGETTTRNDWPYLYDSNGKAYELILYVHQRDTPDGNLQFALVPSKTMVSEGDFARCDLAYDRTAHFAFGEAIAEAITSSGWALHYNHAGEDVYETNFRALLEVIPFIFHPIYAMEAMIPSSSSYYSGFTGWLEAQNNLLTPVLHVRQSAQGSKHAFELEANEISGFAKTSLVYLTSWRDHDQAPIEYISISLLPLGTENNIYIGDVMTPWPRVKMRSCEVFGLNDYSPYAMTLEGSEAETFPLIDTSSKVISLKRYTFEEIDLAQAVDGYLELAASFGKIDRSGKLIAERLTDIVDAELNPHDYSSLWFDEFNVEGIGSVFLPTEDGAPIVLRIASGRSVYDLTGNYVLKKIPTLTETTALNQLRESFAPHLLPISFTPIDISMKGLPYLEAGDSLQIVTEDGVSIHSYNMQQEQTGIHVLTNNIKSTGGEIINTEVDDQ